MLRYEHGPSAGGSERDDLLFLVLYLQSRAGSSLEKGMVFDGNENVKLDNTC